MELLRRTITVLAGVLALAAASPAPASEHFEDRNVRKPTLRVNAGGQALVEYTTERGVRRHVLLWGAVNAKHPSETEMQVRFRRDFTGGVASTGRAQWRKFKNVCAKYDGPQLPYLVAACKAPDGTYWALQTWQRRLPLLGFDPWLPMHDDYELHVSHWSGPLPVLEMYANWTYSFTWQGVFGRFTYLGQPVYGFKATREGNPLDRYNRNVYIDTYNSAYGTGWRRESGILTHRRTGTFCHSFVPQKPFAGYPSLATRPPAPGERYRVTVMGPGVTPVLQTEIAALPRFDGSGAHLDLESRANATFDQVMAGDRICAHER